MPEHTIKTLKVYGKNCIGCQRFHRDIMIAYQSHQQSNELEITDLFLTQAEAINLRNELDRILADNYKSEKEALTKQ